MEGHETITILGEYKIKLYNLEAICEILMMIFFFVPMFFVSEVGIFIMIFWALGFIFLGCSVYLWNISKMNKITKSDYYFSIGLILLMTIITGYALILQFIGDLENSSWGWFLIFFIWFFIIMEAYPVIQRYQEKQ